MLRKYYTLPHRQKNDIQHACMHHSTNLALPKTMRRGRCSCASSYLRPPRGTLASSSSWSILGGSPDEAKMLKPQRTEEQQQQQLQEEGGRGRNLIDRTSNEFVCGCIISEPHRLHTRTNNMSTFRTLQSYRYSKSRVRRVPGCTTCNNQC